MTAIRTKWHAGDDRRKRRITATNASGQKCTIPAWGNEQMAEHAHRLAAEALCAKLNQPTRLAAGQLKDGWVFVPLPAQDKLHDLATFIMQWSEKNPQNKRTAGGALYAKAAAALAEIPAV